MSATTHPTEPEPTPFERMVALAKNVLSVPKTEIDKRDKKWHAKRRKALAQKKRSD